MNNTTRGVISPYTPPPLNLEIYVNFYAQTKYVPPEKGVAILINSKYEAGFLFMS
jgi:hypothetical protein